MSTPSAIVSRWTRGCAVWDLAGDTSVGYQDLWDAAEQWASELRRMNVGPRRPLVAVLRNDVAFVRALLAAWLLDAPFVPLSPSAPPDERRSLIEQVEAACVLMQVPDPDLAGAWQALPGGAHASARPGSGELRVDAALVLFTSGSTGRPKGVLLSAGSVAAGCRAVVSTYGLDGSDRTLALLPWTHGHGLIGVLLSSLVAGGTVLVAPQRAIGSTMDVPLGVTWLSLVPPLLSRLCQHPLPARSWPLRFIRTASAALAPALAAQAEHHHDCPVAEAYGMTETAHQAAANPPLFAQRALGSVGTPTGMTFRLDESPDPLGREVLVRGPALFDGYLDRRDLHDAMTADGWYRTGDVGNIDGAGRIWLLGRRSELINRGGTKVSPLEIERVTMDIPGVEQALAAGVPDRVMGEEIGLLVVPTPESRLSTAAVRSALADVLPAYRRPRIVQIVDALPVLGNGKPSRKLAAAILRSSEHP